MDGTAIPMPAFDTMMSSLPKRRSTSETISAQRASLVSVLLPEDRLAAGLGDAADNLGTPEFVDVGCDDGRALLCEQLRDRLANARCSAGHERDLTFHLPCR